MDHIVNTEDVWIQAPSKYLWQFLNRKTCMPYPERTSIYQLRDTNMADHLDAYENLQQQQVWTVRERESKHLGPVEQFVLYPSQC